MVRPSSRSPNAEHAELVQRFAIWAATKVASLLSSRFVSVNGAIDRAPRPPIAHQSPLMDTASHPASRPATGILAVDICLAGEIAAK